MGRRYLVTGGAGFIGSNFIRYLLGHEAGAAVTNLDLLTYAGVEATVRELDADSRHAFVRGDIGDAALLDRLLPGHDVVVNFAAESHVDRSITGPAVFLQTNVRRPRGAARRRPPRTASLASSRSPPTRCTARWRRASPPRTPRSAPLPLLGLQGGRRSARRLRTRRPSGYPVIVTRCTNNYGPYQFPEKVIPLFVTNLLDGRKVPLYGDGAQRARLAARRGPLRGHPPPGGAGTAGEVYNIGADAQLPNIELTRRILAALGKGEDMIERVADRPGHDLRYAVDSSKLRRLGWAPARSFEEHLAATVEWYRRRPDWWRPLKEGSRS